MSILNDFSKRNFACQCPHCNSIFEYEDYSVWTNTEDEIIKVVFCPHCFKTVRVEQKEAQ